MATAQNSYSVAWCLHVKATPAIYAATTDLPEDAAVTTLGAFYTRRIVNIDAQLTQELPNLFFGMPSARAVEFVLDNSDGAFSSATDYRLTPVVLYFYDRINDTKTTDLTGFITQAKFLNSRVTLTIGSYNQALFDELLPAAVIDPVVGSPFAKSGAAGAPVPILFGENVPVRAASANTQDDPAVSDPPGYDFVVSHGGVYVRAVYQEIDNAVPGLERIGAFTPAPGSPTYVSTTKFAVTGDQRVRYLYDTGQGGMHIRFKTTASGTTYRYSSVKAYDATATPHQVEIEDALLGVGLNSVEIAGDFFAIRGAYQDVTDGLLPVPAAPGADMTAVRLYDPGDSATIVVADNPAYPLATTYPGTVIEAILTNATWGLSTRTAQAVNATSFAAANLQLIGAALTGAVCGAIGYDGQQRRAGNVLEDILMMRGMRLAQNDSLEWTLTVDATPGSPTKVFELTTGDYQGIPIKRVLDHGRVAAEQGVRTLVLHWAPMGRSSDGNARFNTSEYAYRSSKPVSSVGSDRHIYNQFLRDATIAEKVCHYIGEKLKGADERLAFVAGHEARDVTLGEVLTVNVPSDGISGDWQVYGIQKTLTDVTLTCIRANATAYGATSGVTTTSTPVEGEYRTATGSGSNLITNPDFSGPYRTNSGVVQPYKWNVGPSSVTVTIDYSSAVVADLIGGHYLRCVTAADSTPSVPSSYAIVTQTQPCPPSRALIGSFYCDADDGVFAYVIFTGTATTNRVIGLVRDANDTNGLGWSRYYFRTFAPSTTKRVALGIGFSKTGTYQIEAVQLEATQRTARKPSPWRRHTPVPRSEKAEADITFTGTSSKTATLLIPAGCKVIGVTTRITTAIVLGTATSYSIGTDGDPYAWGTGLTATAVGSTTDAHDFETRVETYFPTATDVVVLGNGTITSGVMHVTVEYQRPAPASGA